MANKIISQIQLDELYDINAKYLEGHSYAELVDLINKAQFVLATSAETTPEGVVWNNGTTNITGTLKASDSARGYIYLVKHTHTENPSDSKDIYDEYVVVGSGSSYIWERVGNTDIDLSDYCKKGTETGAATGNTTSAGGEEVTTSPAGAVNATSSLTITYNQAANSTQLGSGATVTTTVESGAHSHKFTGATATISVSGGTGTAESNGSHSHEVDTNSVDIITEVNPSTGTVYSAPAATENVGGHDHTVTVNSHTHGDAVTVVKSVTEDTKVSVVTGVRASGSTQVITGVAGGNTAEVLTGVKASGTAAALTGVKISSSTSAIDASVSGQVLVLTSRTGLATGVASDGTRNFVTGVEADGKATVLTSVVASGTVSVLTGVEASGTTSVLPGISVGTVSVAGLPSAATLTAAVSSNGGHSHSISRSSLAVVTGISTSTGSALGSVTIKSAGAHTHNVVGISASGSYQPAGTIESDGVHTHQYNAPYNHTHQITITPTDITKAISIGIDNHVHTVQTSDHVHGLNSHTHTQK